MTALGKRIIHRLTKPFNCFDSPVCDRCFIFLESKEFTFEVLVIETVIDKVDQIRADCLSAFCFQKFCQMIVCSRKEFDKDFSDDANTWFLFVCDWQGVKFSYHLAADTVKLCETCMFSGNKFHTTAFPFAVQGICRTLYGFIRTHPVKTFHEDITKYCTVSETGCKFWCNLKSGIGFESA